MSLFEKNQKLDTASMDGIWLDYKDHVWFFFVKDRAWDREEVQRAERSDVTVSFVQKGIVDAFLLEIFDCLETSDIPFCIKDAEGELLDSFNDKQDYRFEVVLVTEDNTVAAVRTLPFTHENSLKLKEKLNARMSENYDSDAFDKAYAKLEAQLEPYELEPFAVFTQKN